MLLRELKGKGPPGAGAAGCLEVLRMDTRGHEAHRPDLTEDGAEDTASLRAGYVKDSAMRWLPAGL